jgi:POT family proton-dependent oligopeptide transporter
MLLFGVFHALSYVGGLPAGILTDRKLGPLVALLIGCALLTLGYGALALDHAPLFWPALTLMVIGHSFFKPSMGTLFGGLFQSADARRERGFFLQHLAVNISAMAGPLCGEWSRAGERWNRLFVWSAVMMCMGTAALAVGKRLLPKQSQRSVDAATVIGSPQTDRARWGVVWWLCGLSVVFWLTAQQSGSSLVVFAESHTERSIVAFGRAVQIGPGHFGALHGFQVLLLLPLLMGGMAWLRRRQVEPSTLAKMTWGYVATAAAFVVLVFAGIRGGDTGRVSPLWLSGAYLQLSAAELLLSPLGMSLITRIVPPQRTSQAVGLWFAAAAVGNASAGAIGLLWGRWPNHRYFALLAAVSLGAALTLWFRLPRLARLLTASHSDAERGHS